MDDRVILTKLILGEELITILIAYVPQLELHGDVKKWISRTNGWIYARNGTTEKIVIRVA